MRLFEKKYPSYKPSSLEWIGPIPESWERLKLKNVAVIIPGQSPSSSDVNRENIGTPFLQGCAEFGVKTPTPLNWCSAESKASAKGDWLISVRAPVGELNFSDQKYGIGRGVAAIRGLEGEINTSYLGYLLKNSKTYFDSVSTGSTFKAVTGSDIANLPIFLPSEIEQLKIANFLDSELLKINQLIQKQENLISVLNEKRKVEIGNAVTKGFNKTSNFYDSHIDWIGNIPEHWVMSKLKYVKAKKPNAFVDGPFGSDLKSEHYIFNGDVYVIESNFATQGKLVREDLKTISQNHFLKIQRSEVLAGDIVIAKIGAYFGRSNILPELDKPAVVSGNSLKFSVDELLATNKWVHYFLIHLKNNDQIDLLVNGSAQPALSLGAMNELRILIPPISEQKSIIKILEDKLQAIDQLILKSKESIYLLNEHSTSLISAAVTGQIDVRESK